MRKSLLSLIAFCLLLSTAASAKITDRAELLAGHVEVIQLGDRDLLVTLDGGAGEVNGLPDQAFVYRSSTQLPEALPRVVEVGRLVVRESSITLFAEGRRALCLAVISEGAKPLRRSPDTVTITSGYQLSRLEAVEGVDLLDLAYDLVRTPDEAWPFEKAMAEGPGGGGGETCVAGGPGATSCSIAASVNILGNGVGVTCSVSCGTGYYSCCGLKGCTCRTNG